MDSYTKKINIVPNVNFNKVKTNIIDFSNTIKKEFSNIKLNGINLQLKQYEKELNSLFAKIKKLDADAKNVGGSDYSQYKKLRNQAKNIRLSIADRKSKGLDSSNLQNELHDLEQQIDGFESLFELNENFAELNRIVKELNETEEEYNQKNKDLKSGQALKDMSNKNKELKQQLTDYGKQIFSKVGDVMIDFIKDLTNNAKEILDEMASYNLGGSLTINRDAREQALRYGLTDIENYGFTKAMEEMGISSEEDLFYMNEAQRERFAERMGYYSDKYKQMSDEGFLQDWQKYQIEMKEFKEEMYMDVAKFFVDNKDMIREVMSFGLDFMKFVMNTLGAIVETLNFGNERNSYATASAMADIINSHSSNVNNSKAVTQNNNYSISSPNLAVSNANENYRQILEVFK